jgi:hypothetical protein
MPDINVLNFGNPYSHYIPERTLTLKIKRVFFKALLYLPDDVESRVRRECCHENF